MTDLPGYDELPIRPDLPAKSSWGVWGDDDVLGCLNLLTPDRVASAAQLVRKGAVFPLNLPIDVPNPSLYGRGLPEHELLEREGSDFRDDRLNHWNPQSSSQWDGFLHLRGPSGFYNGLPLERHGVGHWADRGIAGRGVLADVARWRESEGRPLNPDACEPVDPDDITGALRAGGTEMRPGDILLVRTGWLSWYRSLDARGREQAAHEFRAPGLRPGEQTARFLWNSQVAAIAADNPALECWPPGGAADQEARNRARANPAAMREVFAHYDLLPLLGIPIGELWDLDGLATDCAEDGVYEFLLTSAPLNVPGGVSSPPNALALK